MKITITDSAEHAQVAKASLDVSRHRAKELGLSALHWLRRKAYEGPSGEWIDLTASLDAAIAAKVSISPEATLPTPPTREPLSMDLEFANVSALVAAKRLVTEGERPLVLNFANGKTPGGGFLSGSLAQEEALCRASGLYLTLEDDPMYKAHALRPLPDSTEWAILSPNVPVFRRDHGVTEPKPWMMDVLTCAAPVASRMNAKEAAELLGRRIARVLAIADAYGYTCLVLGAWGCGAFGNNSALCARDFHRELSGPFAGRFGKIVFAITDWAEPRHQLAIFAGVFSRMSARRELKAHTLLADLSDRFHDEFGMWLGWEAIVSPHIDFDIWLNWIQSVSAEVNRVVEENPNELSWNTCGYIDCHFQLCGSIQEEMLLILPKNHPLAELSRIPGVAKERRHYTELGAFVWLYAKDLTDDDVTINSPIPVVMSEYYLENHATLVSKFAVENLNKGTSG